MCRYFQIFAILILIFENCFYSLSQVIVQVQNTRKRQPIPIILANITQNFSGKVEAEYAVIIYENNTKFQWFWEDFKTNKGLSSFSLGLNGLGKYITAPQNASYTLSPNYYFGVNATNKGNYNLKFNRIDKKGKINQTRKLNLEVLS